MNFEHTEDRRMLADTLNRYIAERYSFEARMKIAQSAHGFSKEHWRQFADLGVIGALFDEADGGFGGGGFDLSVVFEALGRGLVVEPFLGTLMAGSAIALAGHAAQKGLLTEMIAGNALVTFAHDEVGAHYQLERVCTRAERAGERWILSGAKSVVACAEQADHFVVSARTAGRDDDEAGISLFVVPANASGAACSGYLNIDGGRSAELALDRVELPAEALLGTAGAGCPLLESVTGRGLVALCAEALGTMEVARSATLEYLQTRKQFGVPIGSFQALQHRMAGMLLEIEQARSAVINAAASLDADRMTRERALSAAKFTIGRTVTLVAEESIQMHGGIGMTWELPLAHYAKRMVMIDHQLGDEDHHLDRFVALAGVVA